MKTLEEEYPSLRFDKSYEGIMGLENVEGEVVLNFVKKYSIPIKIWEYGYYYLTLFIQRSTIQSSYSPLAALFSEAHSSLRTTFILNNRGYHADSIALLRRVHEATVKMIAGKMSPKKMWTLVMDNSLQSAESKIGVNLNWINNVESSYIHANRIKVLGTGISLQNKQQIAIPYGPQENHQEYVVSINLSIFWMYVLVLVIPVVFPNQILSIWLEKRDESLRILKDYLKNLSSNKLLLEVEKFEKILDKI